MKLLKLLLLPFMFLIKTAKKIRRRWIIAKAARKMEPIFQKQVAQRKELRKDINLFLREYFGIGANSRFIPPDFKNSEEVKVAVIGKFNIRMENLNVKYQDIFA